ncbi:hypothetical protein [Chryseobacterium aquaticum]|uniref:O-antigen polymerase n=1 Tax=Chryseobacterium aquaticum subsp. greenlandense TaxID=345663 RepID=A0A117KD21_9FLAO|nr:hypothetical protein [Chryseobacterium aquaticum]KUJ58271.1 hypothetical protein AR686_00230 [Chryseobacterium aquaticum subsp. greenlandense]
MSPDTFISKFYLKMFLGLYMALFFIAPSIFYFGLSSSFMLGTIFCLVFWLAIHFLFKISSSIHFDLNMVYSYSFTASFLLLHFVIVFFLFQYNANVIRGFSSLLLVLFFLFSAFVFHEYFSKLNNEEVDYIMKIMLIIFFIIFLLSLIKPLQQKFEKSIFPYTESSHFALFFSGCLYYTTVRYKKYRVLLIIFALVCALYLKNLTLLVCVIVLSLCLFKFWMVFINTLIAVLVYNFVDLSYFSDRVENLSSDSSNLSTLVFVQGWELAISALKKSNGLGIGLQQLGQIKLESRSSKIIYLLTRKEFNISDAGLTAPKIICEFGIFGIIGLMIYTIIALKGVLYLRNYRNGHDSNNILLAYCIIISFFTELFVRGVGYFAGTFFMTLVSFIYICSTKRKKTIKYDTH